jgi:hypothetical protein
MHTELIGTEVVPRTDSQAVAKVGGGQAVHVGWVARQEGGAQTVRQARKGLSWTTIPKEGGLRAHGLTGSLSSNRWALQHLLGGL